MTLGERVRGLRQKQGLTLALVAQRAQISVSYLNDIEHDRTVPSLPKLEALSRALGMNAAQLLRGVVPYGV